MHVVRINLWMGTCTAKHLHLARGKNVVDIFTGFFVDLRAGQDGRFSIENIVDLQSLMQGAKP